MYTLTAKAHERAAIKLLNTSGKELLKMEVWDARHDRVCNYLWNVPPAGDPGCLFPRDGAYTIEIAPYDQAATDPIAYAVTVLRLDDPSTARPIAPAQPQTGSLERGIAIHTYTLDAKADERVAIKVLNTSGKELLATTVWDAKHNRVCGYLGSAPAAGDPGCLLPSAGTYTIEIESDDQTAAGPIAYAVTVLRLDDPSAARPIAPAQPQTGSLESGIAIHAYTLDARDNEQVSIKVLNTSGKELLATTVWNAKHERVCGYLGSAPASSDPACLLPSAGTYTIEIESSDQTVAGPIAYTLSLDDMK